MKHHAWISALGISGFFLLPAGVLLFMTFAVWTDRLRDQLSGTRRKVFRAALYISCAALITDMIWNVHFAGTGDSPDYWYDLLWAVIVLWFLGFIGAFWGKGKGRILLVLTQIVFAVMFCGFMLAFSP
jgi:amino acid transporter